MRRGRSRVFSGALPLVAAFLWMFAPVAEAVVRRAGHGRVVQALDFCVGLKQAFAGARLPHASPDDGSGDGPAAGGCPVGSPCCAGVAPDGARMSWGGFASIRRILAPRMVADRAIPTPRQRRANRSRAPPSRA